MRTNEPNHCREHSSIEEKLATCVRALLESAKRLREALAARNPDGIWEALGEQEEQASLLNEYGTLWQELGETIPVADDERRRLRLEIKRLQALQRANSMLAQSFLSAVRKAIGGVSEQTSNPAGTYSKAGRRRGAVNAGLVQRLG